CRNQTVEIQAAVAALEEQYRLCRDGCQVDRDGGWNPHRRGRAEAAQRMELVGGTAQEDLRLRRSRVDRQAAESDAVRHTNTAVGFDQTTIGKGAGNGGIS